MTSLAWLGGMKYLGQIVSWAITILVIRILNPEDYGLMAMASVCTNFLVMISELGLGAAIVQKRELSQEQLSQVFGFIIISHILLFIALFLGAHLIAGYFSEPRLVPILQVLSFNFLILSLYVIPRSVLMRKMDFKRKSIADLVATVFAAFVSLGLALSGFGVWALAWSSVAIHLAYLVGYNVIAPGLFLPKFRFRGIQDFISFGAYTLASRMLWYFYSKSDILIGGRILENQLLGIYSVALELAQIPLDKFMPIINEVAFPAYSSIQSDLKLVASHFLKAARIGSLLVFPAFWGLLVVAPEILGWLLGEKWSDIIVPVQIICVIMPFRALGTLVSPMLFGIGRVDVNLYYVAIASVIMPICFFIGAHYGVSGICLGWVVGYMLVFFVTLKLSLGLLSLSILKFLSNISVAFFASSAMVLLLFGIKYTTRLLLPLPVVTCILILMGMGSYCFFVFVMKKEAFYEMWGLIPGHEKVNAFLNRYFVHHHK